MSAAEKREALKALLKEHRLNSARVAAVLSDVDSCARARVRESREPKPSVAKKPPAVHFEARPGRPACRPFDLGTGGWATTSAPGGVTCGHCRKTPAWQSAGGAR